MQNDPSKGRYFTPTRSGARSTTGAQAAVAQVPGVRQVALVSRLPYRGRGDTRFEIEGRPTPPDQPSPVAEVRQVTPELLPDDADPDPAGAHARRRWSIRRGPVEVVINQTMAAKYWPGEDPIGRRIQLFGPQGPVATIVGVAGRRAPGARRTSRRARRSFLSSQRFPGQEMAFVVRTDGDPDATGTPR